MPEKKIAAALFALAVLCAPCAPPAVADELVLSNGDHLSGKVVRKEGDAVVVNTPYAGDLNVTWSDIRRITMDEPAAVYLYGGNKMVGTLRSDEDGLVVITSGDRVLLGPTPIGRIQFLNPSAEVSGEGAKVTGHINAGLSSTSGNTQATKMYLDTEGVARTRDDRYTLGARGAHTRDREVETESNWLGYMKYDRFFTRKWYGYANGDFENDRFKDIRLRSTLGLGSGYQFFESQRTNLSLEGGLTYVHTDSIVGEDEAYPAARWALKYDHMLFGSKIQFFHMHETYVGLDDETKIFVRSQTGLRIPLMDRLNATAQYNVDWDNTPAADQVRTDKTVLLTLGYTW
jgi:putative salt-induced outer membrane protein YdiY